MERSEQLTDSLYDFIYIDTHKSKILLAQIESNGIITQIKNRYEQQETSESKAALNTVIGFEKNRDNSNTESTEQSFDTALSVHLRLLHKLSEQQRINKNINKSKVGDIILFTGLVEIFDISTIKQLITSGSLDRLKKDKHWKEIAGFIKVIPATVQFTFKDENENRAWMTLPDHNLLMPSSELLLKYGNGLEGVWSVIGILDSLPGEVNRGFVENREYIADLGDISNQFKAMVGKHRENFGITPLMIFRQIG